jgi:alkyl hydroperoxide reductase subunit AhpC
MKQSSTRKGQYPVEFEFECPCFLADIKQLPFFRAMSANVLGVLVDHEFVYTFAVT